MSDKRCIQWNTQPQIYSGSSVTFNQPVSSLASEIDVTNIVQNWANGSYTNYGFFVDRLCENAFFYYTTTSGAF